MAGKGPKPDPNAVRRNKDKQWSEIEWTDEDWAELLESGDVLAPPDTAVWVVAGVDGPGRRANAMWHGIWTGPLRNELLPMHMPELEALCEATFNAEHAPIAERTKWMTQSRMLGKGFGTNPAEVRGMRVKVATKKQATKTTATKPAGVRDESRRKRIRPTAK